MPDHPPRIPDRRDAVISSDGHGPAVTVILPSGLVLTPASEDDMPYVAGSIGADILDSVDPSERETAPLWLDPIIATAMEGIASRRMRDEVMVLRRDGERAGFIWIGESVDQFTCEPTGYILGIRVEEGLRRTGAGTEMLEWAESVFRGRGLASATLNVGAANGSAERFYAVRGYLPRSIVMRKPLL